MCGVAGVIRLDGGNIEPSLLTAMTDAIAHRGPDGEGQWIEGNVGIGHRRLSIIDLSETGHQPMVDASNRFVLSYNGEVYNFKELRRELEKLGHRFRGKSDSEVVLISFVEWGTSAFIKFNGMFALSIWDRKERVLTLARDRYGIKPLYYAHQAGVFSFASEQKAIIANTEFDRNLNKVALLEYFTFQNIFTDQTLLEDIRIVKAGHFLQLTSGSLGVLDLTQSQYWDFAFKEPEEKVEPKAYSEELRRLFSQAVDRQLVSDVEVGSYLSGGMDSGSVVALASQKVENLKTFTVGFDLSSATGVELGFDERAKSELMSSAFGTEHYEIVLKSGDMEKCLGQLAWHIEEPRVGQSYPNFYAAKLAGNFVKVVLSGVGGDELFGGYPWRYFRPAESSSFESYIDRYYVYWQRLVDNREIRMLFEPIWEDVKDVWTRDIFQNVFQNHSNELRTPADYVNHSLYFEAKTFLHGLLVVEDKISMAHGLETRLPFLDNDLVDFAMACPVNLKLRNLVSNRRIDENFEGSKKVHYDELGKEGKMILRDTMKPVLPVGVSERRKQGFSSPDASWFRNESAGFVKKAVLLRSNPLFKYVSRVATSRMIGEHQSGEKNRRLLVWSFLNVSAALSWLVGEYRMREKA